ncbi:MAG: AAA family ATPase [Oscillochloridaceae bacterium umkhey_bin13]
MPRPATNQNEAANLLKAQLARMGWTIDGLLARLAEHGLELSRASFDNYCRAINRDEPNPRRRNRGFPADPNLIGTLMQVLVEDAPPALRWSPAEALAFAAAVQLPPAELAQFGGLFGNSPAFYQTLVTMLPADATLQSQAAVALLDQLPIQQLPERLGPPARRFGPLPDPVEPFVGREGELQQLAYLLKTTPRARVLIHGLPGLGKTSFVSEFAHRYGQFFVGGVFFLVADQLALLRRELLDLGTTYLLTDPAHLAAPASQQLELIRAALEQAPPTLLIFDNIDQLEPEQLEALLPRAGQCRVVLTGRRSVRGPHWQPFALAALPLHSSTRLLHSAAHLSHFEKTALRGILQPLAEQFDGLPLALSLAAGYLREQAPTSLAELQQLAQNLERAPLLHPTAGAPNDSHQRLNFFLDQLDPAHPIHQPARRLLALAALFPPGQPIELDLLRRMTASPGNSIDGSVEPIPYLDDALALLRTRSLLLPGPNYSLSMHRLVRSLVREQPEHRAAVIQASSALWHWLITERPPAAQELLEDLHPYLELISTLATDCAQLTLSHAAELAYLLGWYQIRNSAVDAGLHWTQRAVDLALHQWGHVHPITAEAYCRLGLAHLFRNEFAAAQAAYAQMLAIQAQIYPLDHPERQTGLKNMAQLLLIAGDEAASEQYARMTLAVARAQVLPAEPAQQAPIHLRFGRLIRLLGQQAAENGRPWRGYRYYRYAEQLVTPNRVALAQLWADRAYLALSLGRFDEAEQLLDQSAQFRHELHANQRDQHGRYWHYNLAEIDLLRAQCWLAQGYPEPAAPLLDEAHAIVLATLGIQSQEFIQVREAQAELALQRGQYATADALLNEVAARFQALFGPGPIRQNLRLQLRTARLAMINGQAERATLACAAVLSGCASKGWHSHPLALWAEALLAEQARLRGDEAAALTHWARIMPLLRRTLRRHPIIDLLANQGPLPALNPGLIPLG